MTNRHTNTTDARTRAELLRARMHAAPTELALSPEAVRLCDDAAANLEMGTAPSFEVGQ